MMLCCTECFNDQFLIDYITDHGKIDTCSYCGIADVSCIDVQDLTGLFDLLINLYSPLDDFMPIEELKELDVYSEYYLWELLQSEWEIFSSDDETMHERIIRDMYKEYHPGDPDKYLLDSYWRDTSKYWGIDVEINDELKSEWQVFRDEFIYKNRFFPKNNFDLKIIERLLPLLSFTYQPGQKLFRARKSITKAKFPCSGISKPPAALASAGRANPQGIAYLYTASNSNTAICEVRSTINNFVTVGTLVCNSTLNLIDLRAPHIKSPFEFGSQLDFFLMHLGFLEILGNELSQHVSPSASIYEYLPSQYLCEFIKVTGYDGVIYKSSLGPGFNVVLFDSDSKVKCDETKLYEVTAHDKFDLVP